MRRSRITNNLKEPTSNSATDCDPYPVFRAVEWIKSVEALGCNLSVGYFQSVDGRGKLGAKTCPRIVAISPPGGYEQQDAFDAMLSEIDISIYGPRREIEIVAHLLER